MQFLWKNNSWELALLSKGKKIIGCKWVYAKKEEFSNKKDIHYKARFIAKGCAQKVGIDCNEVFSPIIKHSLIRTFLTFVARLNLELTQLDVKTKMFEVMFEEGITMFWSR